MATSIACIIGWPASKSLSPAIHKAAFAATGLDWDYVAIDVAPQDLPQAIDDLRAIPIAGANVTMPHKQSVMALLDGVDPTARRVGAVNTIVVAGGRFTGTNTDGAGFIRFLQEDAAMTPADLNVLLLGAGGAARAVACALTDAGARVTVTARRTAAAIEVADRSGAAVCAWEAAPAAAGSAGVIVNATSAGMQDLDIPIDLAAISPEHVVIDLIYSPESTPLLDAARARGATVHNGLGMLLHQAALSFEIWTGVPAPFEAMSAAGHRAL